MQIPRHFVRTDAGPYRYGGNRSPHRSGGTLISIVGENCVLPNLYRAKGALSPQTAHHGGRSQNAPTGMAVIVHSTEAVKSTFTTVGENCVLPHH